MANSLLLIAFLQFQSLPLVPIELSLVRILKRTIQRKFIQLIFILADITQTSRLSFEFSSVAICSSFDSKDSTNSSASFKSFEADSC